MDSLEKLQDEIIFSFFNKNFQKLHLWIWVIWVMAKYNHPSTSVCSITSPSRLNLQMTSFGRLVNGLHKKECLGLINQGIWYKIQDIKFFLMTYKLCKAFWTQVSRTLKQGLMLTYPSRQNEPPLGVMSRGQSHVLWGKQIFYFLCVWQEKNQNSSK